MAIAKQYNHKATHKTISAKTACIFLSKARKVDRSTHHFFPRIYRPFSLLPYNSPMLDGAITFARQTKVDGATRPDNVIEWNVEFNPALIAVMEARIFFSPFVAISSR